MKSIHFIRPAELEMLDAAQYYEAQASGLGEDFLNKIESAVQDISQQPDRWPIVQLDVRRRLVHRFPYAVLFRITKNEILILAVAHLHRRPDYWLGRI